MEANSASSKQLEHVVRLALTCGYFREGLLIQLAAAKEEIAAVLSSTPAAYD